MSDKRPLPLSRNGKPRAVLRAGWSTLYMWRVFSTHKIRAHTVGTPSHSSTPACSLHSCRARKALGVRRGRGVIAPPESLPRTVFFSLRGGKRSGGHSVLALSGFLIRCATGAGGLGRCLGVRASRSRSRHVASTSSESRTYADQRDTTVAYSATDHERFERARSEGVGEVPSTTTLRIPPRLMPPQLRLRRPQLNHGKLSRVCRKLTLPSKAIPQLSHPDLALLQRSAYGSGRASERRRCCERVDHHPYTVTCKMLKKKSKPIFRSGEKKFKIQNFPERPVAGGMGCKPACPNCVGVPPRRANLQNRVQQVCSSSTKSRCYHTK